MNDIHEIVKEPDAPEAPAVKREVKPKKPSMWHVILLNDDFTPMNFVVAVLVRFFNKGPEEATMIMLDVHKKGRGIAGTYTLEVCEMKVGEVMLEAHMHGFPLRAIVEKVG